MKYLFLIVIPAFLFSCSKSENVSSPTLSFNELFTVNVDTLQLDMISSSVENSLYLSYSANNGLNENLLKYDLVNNSTTSIIHPDVSESRQIEIIGNDIYSISSNEIYKFDLQLTNTNLINAVYNSCPYLRTVSDNNKIIIPTRLNEFMSFDTSTNSYQTVNTLPHYRYNADSEIVNGKLYVFGGSDDLIQPTNEIKIYDMSLGTWALENLPYPVYESFSDVHNNTIIIAGNKQSDFSQAFIGIYDPITNSFNELTTSLDLNNITIRSITVLNNDLYIAYTDWTANFPALINIKVAKTSL